MIEIVYKTEKCIGKGTSESPYRTLYQFWKREGDKFLFICEFDTLNNQII